MTFSNKFMSNSPLRKEEPKDEDNLEYTTKSDSGMSDAEYAKYFGEGSIHRPNLDEVVVTAPKNKRVGETALVDTSTGSSFPTGASTETIKQWYANNPPKDTIKDLSKPDEYQGGSILGSTENIKDLKTILSNPFDAARAIVRTDNSGGDFPTTVEDLRALRELADRDDGSESSKQAKNILSGSSGFNVASAMFPPVMAAQTFVDAGTGDLSSVILGKAKKLKPIAKTLKKSKIGNLIKGKASKYTLTGEAGILPAAYVGYKGYKQSKKL